MFSQKIFDFVCRLLFSRHHEAHHGSGADTYTAAIGPLHLAVNQCVAQPTTDHKDAHISVHLPAPGGKWHLGYVVCLSADERCPQFYLQWQPSLPQVVYGQARQPTSSDDFPF